MSAEHHDQNLQQRLFAVRGRVTCNKTSASPAAAALEQRQRLEDQREEIPQKYKYGLELLALIKGDFRAKVLIYQCASQSLCFRMNLAGVISKSDGVPIGQIVLVYLVAPPSEQGDH